jgi:Skp family chaperone for outer membrane proteins
MSQSPVWWRVLVLSCITMFIAYSVRASGQGGKTGQAFGIIDEIKLSAEYKAKENLDTELRNMGNKFNQRLQRRADMAFLSKEEHETLDGLYEKATQTDQDKAKITELETKARKRAEEINTLSQKKQTELSDAEKKTLDQGSKDFREAQQRYALVKENLETESRSYINTQTEDLRKKVRAAVAKVAEQKGIAIVFSSEVTFYAGTDLTQAVLAELNKK